MDKQGGYLQNRSDSDLDHHYSVFLRMLLCGYPSHLPNKQALASLLLVFLLWLLSPLFLLPSSHAGETLDLSLLCYSSGTAAQSNSFNYHTQPALSYHRGCAAPSVFPSWLCREDRHLHKVSWSASLLSWLSLSLLALLAPFFFPPFFSFCRRLTQAHTIHNGWNVVVCCRMCRGGSILCKQGLLAEGKVWRLSFNCVCIGGNI